MRSLFQKEIHAYLSSWISTLGVLFFLLVTALFLWVFPDSSTNIFNYGQASLSNFFDIAPYILLLLIPAYTMRLLAEEFKEGTFELLVTAPIRSWDIILGKFLAAYLLGLLCLIPTLFYFYTVYALGSVPGNIDFGQALGSYIGLILLIGTFTAMGLFASSVTKAQVPAFLLAVFICFFMLSGWQGLSSMVALRSMQQGLIAFGIQSHYAAISRGVLDTRDFIYFISLMFFFLLAAKFALEARKW